MFDALLEQKSKEKEKGTNIERKKGKLSEGDQYSLTYKWHSPSLLVSGQQTL